MDYSLVHIYSPLYSVHNSGRRRDEMRTDEVRSNLKKYHKVCGAFLYIYVHTCINTSVGTL